MRIVRNCPEGRAAENAIKTPVRLPGDAYPAATMLGAFMRLGPNDLQNARLACRAFAEIGKTSSSSAWQELLQTAINREPERLHALLERAAARGCLRHMKRFESVCLSEQQISDLIAALAEADAQAFQRLSLRRSNLGADGARALANATQWTALQHLDLGGNNHDADDARALAGATQWTALQHLNLAHNNMGDAGEQAVANATHLRGVYVL